MNSKHSALPDGWTVARLGELGEISGGGTPSTKVPEYWGGEISWLVPSEVTKCEGLFIAQTERTITEAGLANCNSRLLPPGTVLMTSRATIGEVVINTVPMATNQGFINIVCAPEAVFNEFLALWIKRNKQVFIERAHGVTFKEITKANFKTIGIALPSLPEQRAIAHALRSVQEAKEARRRELALERERKAALMQHLFTHGTRGEPTKQTEIGEMPESWTVVRLEELCRDGSGVIQTGPFGSQLHASDYKETGIPVVNPTHLGFNSIVEDKLPYISQEDADRLSKHYLKEGDILISRRGDFSRYSYITPKYAGWLCGTGCLLIRLTNLDADNFYLSIWMGTEVVQKYFDQYSVGMIMPNLNTKILQGLPVLLPPIAEQRQIATALHVCDTNIAALEREIVVVDELFRAMLEELMTGRVRAT